MSAKGSKREGKGKGGRRVLDYEQGKPAPTPAPAPALQPAKPLKPRPMLFWGLLGAFVIWLGVLVVLYYRTKL